ncbi:MAG: AI-2E family transporter [Sphingomonadaceae bacterium]|nr:AI-2E family transporter [Sphingomonadaceae bacterium]
MARLTPDRADQRFVRRLALIVIAAALVAFAYRSEHMLLLAFGAALAGVLLAAIADGLVKYARLPRGIGVAIASALLFGALYLIGWLFTDELGGELSQLKARLPQDWARAQATIGQDPLGRLVIDGITQIGHSTHVALAVAGFGVGVGQLAVNLTILLVGAVFFAAQPKLYVDGLVAMTPPAHRGVARDALDDIGRSLRLWLITQIISMLLMGLMIWLGLKWSHMPAAASLGLLGGLSEFIPYVGPTLAMIPPLVIAIAGSGSIAGVLITYTVVRIVQANIITPLISHRVVRVPPALYLFLILSCGAALGTYGLFFSGAISVAIYTLVERVYLRETLGEDVTLPGEE